MKGFHITSSIFVSVERYWCWEKSCKKQKIVVQLMVKKEVGRTTDENRVGGI